MKKDTIYKAFAEALLNAINAGVPITFEKDFGSITFTLIDGRGFHAHCGTPGSGRLDHALQQNEIAESVKEGKDDTDF